MAQLSNLVMIFDSLSQIPLQYKDRAEALKRIAELGKEALGSRLCTLTFVDLENRTMTQEASAGFDHSSEEFRVGRKLSLGGRDDSHHLYLDLLIKGDPIEVYDLQSNGQGVANPEIARKYNLKSGLCYPLKSGGQLVGYINHFSSKSERFTEEEKRLLDIFARQAMITIERFDYPQTLDRSLGILKSLAQNLISTPPEDFLKEIAERACAFLSAPVCLIWKLDEEEKKLRIIETVGEVDDEYRKLKLTTDNYGVKLLRNRKEAAQLLNINRNSGIYTYSDEATQMGWVSLLSAPMIVEDQFIGMLDVYTTRERSFQAWEKEFFVAFANLAALSIQKADLIKENKARGDASRRMEKIVRIMLDMTKARDVDELLKQLLEASLELIEQPAKGSITRIDYKIGKQIVVASSRGLVANRTLQLGLGIIGKAIREEKPIRIRNVQEHKEYIEFWKGTKSELVVPILISNALARVGENIESRSKSIGALNLESTAIEAFSDYDEHCLWMLAQHTAFMIEQLEFERKMENVQRVERAIASERKYDRIIHLVLKGIEDTLEFDYVNISLVVKERKSIETKYVTGISKHDVDKFKRLAKHSLESNDIQAQIVKSGKIVVPQRDDPHLDKEIVKQFRLERLVTVFIPMSASPTSAVIGTVEAGYRSEFRKYIYERDVAVLKDFVEYAGQALESRKVGLLDKISHEFRAPIVGIRNNASFIFRRFGQLSEDTVQTKMDDIQADCEILLHQVSELEYILGRAPRVDTTVERTVLYRDIVIKTINQLRNEVKERGFDSRKIEYNHADSGRIVVYVDSAKLNRVVYNLLINSIKYAEDDPAAFRIKVEVEENYQNFIIKFYDWGIGVGKGLEEKIFEEGFRTDEAEAKDVTGTGLGLTIARGIMREIGGDLKLVHNHKPTVFHMILPKSLKEKQK